ncbi:STAS domain-containing protein [Salipaludibacillus daqingensis]|uniref:STAS domain-containing protein n=1 Tax=Salipaludibacillus daqingensis TaxID=3041001 RepID=UPI002473E895|nr:STAS domain-containing protein [Salipaludibacillus daqingensis]
MIKYYIKDIKVVEELAEIGEAISRQRESIVNQLISHSSENMAENSHALVTDEELFAIRLEFVDMASNLFIHLEPKQSIDEWANKLGVHAISKGGTLANIMPMTKYYREVLWSFIENWTKDKKITNDTIFKASLMLNEIIDKATYSFSVAFIQHHEKKIKETNDFIKEMSAPIVPISSGIGVLPLIGHLDEERSMVLMDTTINEVIAYKLTLIFIDLSGVSVIDTYVASRLSDLMKTLKILGVTPVLSGLRPEMAQTIVSLGIDLSSFKIVSNLRQALMDYGVCIQN